MKVLTIAANDVRRLLRWRANLFFLFVLPMLIILLLGAAFGGSQRAKIGVVNRDRSTLSRQFVGALRQHPSTTVLRYRNPAALQQAVAHGRVDAGLLVPADYGSRLQQGARVTLGYFARPNSVAQQLRLTAQSVAADQSRLIAAAQVLQRQLKISFTDALARR